MTVAYDNFTAGTTGTGDFSFTHTPVGTPRAVILFVIQNVGAGDEVVGATYGGVAMTEMTGSPNLHAGDEPGAVFGYFLGASIPTGAQTVAVDVDATGSSKSVGVITLTGAADTQVEDVDATINTNTGANPSVTLSLGGKSCFCALACLTGIGNPVNVTPLSGWTSRNEPDFGAQVGAYYTYDTVSTTDVTAGWTQTSEDATAICVAITEISSAAVRPRSLLTLGVGS